MSAAAGIYSRDLYNRLVGAFREAGGVARHAARLCGVNERTARKAYLVGWPRYDWARPIQAVLAEEREKSMSVVAERARREAARAEAEGRAAREHSVEAVAQEAAVLTAARKNVLAVFGLSARLVPAMDALVGVVRAATLTPDGKPRPAAEIDLSPEQALGLLKSHAGILSRAMAVGQQVIELGRAERGQASAIVGVAVADLTPEQAAELIEEQEAAVELIRGAGRRGLIRDRPRLLGGPGGPTSAEIVEHREALEAFGAGARPEVDEGDEAAVPRFRSSARPETFAPNAPAEPELEATP